MTLQFGQNSVGMACLYSVWHQMGWLGNRGWESLFYMVGKSVLAYDKGFNSLYIASPHGWAAPLTQWQLILKRDHFNTENSKRTNLSVQTLIKILRMAHWPKIVPWQKPESLWEGLQMDV